MYTDAVFSGYRNFDYLSLDPLARINLLVGKNNTGKTSILEAMRAIASGDPTRLFASLSRRGERLREERDQPRRDFELDVRHLFFGRELLPGMSLEIHASADYVGSMTCEIVEAEAEPPELFEDQASPGRLALQVSFHPDDLNETMPLTARQGLPMEQLRKLQQRPPSKLQIERNCQLVTTESLLPETVADLWAEIALTDEEDQIIEALRVLEPKLERLAFVGIDGSRSTFLRSKDGIVLKLADSSQRVPIGSMGDGMWRMLCLTLAAIRSSRGLLLVDEVDTGLHFTAMENMWRILDSTSRRLNVQIIATTHSYDCVRSLAAICRERGLRQSEVLIHRIENGESSSIKFTEAEIRAAANGNIEVR